jgi:transposase
LDSNLRTLGSARYAYVFSQSAAEQDTTRAQIGLLDCQWLQRLHTFGVLDAWFRPDAELAVLRSYLRHRADLIQHRAPHIQHIQKALALYDFYTQQIATCDAQIEQFYTTLPPRHVPEAESTLRAALPPAKPNSKSKNKPPDSTRAELLRIVGVDLVAVTGLSAALVQTIVSEIGGDMSKFPSAKAFGSWLGVAPHNDISGGRVLRSRTRKVVNRAAQAFRLAAQSVSRTDSAFGAVLSSDAGEVGTAASDCSDSLQDCADGLRYAEEPERISRHRGGGI